MAVKVNFDIERIHPDEEFSLLPKYICEEYKLSHSRYLFSNYSRIFDTSNDQIYLAYPGKAPYFLLRSLWNQFTLIRVNTILNAIIAENCGYDAGTDNIEGITEFITRMITKSSSISGCCILDRNLVSYIRDAYFSKEKDSKTIIDELNISRFSISFAVNEDFVKFETNCEIRENDVDMSLNYMEAVDIITASNPKLTIKTVTKMICDKMGLQNANQMYSKTANYYSGRNGYIYIPKNVQRLVE